MTEEIKIDTIPPGFLVISKIEMRGGIHYERDDVDEYFEDDIRKIKEWNTKSIIDDVDERAEAIKTISTMRRTIGAICANTKVGMLCPAEKKTQLYEAVTEIKELAKEFNSTASTVEISPWFGIAKVKEDNQTVIEAIAGQVAEVCTRVDEALTISDLAALRKAPRRFLKGIKPEKVLELTEAKRDAFLARARAELIRSAISDAKGIHEVLPEIASKEIRETVKQSRKIARALCNRVERKQEDLQEVLNEVDISGIRRTRTAFVKAAAKASDFSLGSTESNQMVVFAPSRKIEI